MGILTSMFTAVTGLSSYGNAMGVIGNNIANVGTAGFKSSRATFSDLISSSLGGGSGSDQIGLGVFLNDVQIDLEIRRRRFARRRRFKEVRERVCA